MYRDGSMATAEPITISAALVTRAFGSPASSARPSSCAPTKSRSAASPSRSVHRARSRERGGSHCELLLVVGVQASVAGYAAGSPRGARRLQARAWRQADPSHAAQVHHRLSRRDAPRQGGRRVRARNPCPTGDVPSLLDGAVASGYDVPIGRTEKAGTFLAPKLVNAAVE